MGLRAAIACGLALLVGCGGVEAPDGDCQTDFDCEVDQLCGQAGRCLLCENCERGRLGTCLGPAYPLERAPDGVRLEDEAGGLVLIYIYACDGASTEFRFDRQPGEACFDPEPTVSDGCSML